MDFTSPDPPIDLNDIDWLYVKQVAKEHGDWYGNRRYSLSEEKRLVNLWYLYAWFKWSGYTFHAAAGAASVMWYASGYNGAIWGTGRYDTLTEPDEWYLDHGWNVRWVQPENQELPPYPVWYKYCHAYPDNYLTLQGSPSAATDNWHTLNWLTPETLPPDAYIASCPSYGISQWTPAIATIMRIMQYADSYFVGLHGENWTRWWPDNTSLQLFGMTWQNYESDNTLPQNQYGSSYHAEWVYNQIVTGYSIPMTWTEYKEGASAEGYDLDLDKFHHSAFNWLSHYIQASTSAQMERDLIARETVYIDYIKPAFEAWDEDGGAGLEDIPAPPGSFFTPGTWNDPINSIYSIAVMGRKKKDVRTILY